MRDYRTSCAKTYQNTPNVKKTHQNSTSDRTSKLLDVLNKRLDWIIKILNQKSITMMAQYPNLNNNTLKP